MTQLIRQPGPVAERTFEITFLDPGMPHLSVGTENSQHNIAWTHPDEVNTALLNFLSER